MRRVRIARFSRSARPIAIDGDAFLTPFPNHGRTTMTKVPTLVPAGELARRAGVTFPNESAAYRRARTALLAEEIELRRHIERVAEQRRALPPGGEVVRDYRFEGENGPADFAGVFGDKQTLVIYTFMFGPQRERPCPMCTSLLSAWDGEARDMEQRLRWRWWHVRRSSGWSRSRRSAAGAISSCIAISTVAVAPTITASVLTAATMPH
jgi:hypothetical protein